MIATRLVTLVLVLACHLLVVSARRDEEESKQVPTVAPTPFQDPASPTYEPLPPPPLYRIEASNLYEAGFQHGQKAKTLIHHWFYNSTEMSELFYFVFNSSYGAQSMQQLISDNSKAFPLLVTEMQGIADGAGVPLIQVWAVNLLQELENLMNSTNTTDPNYGASRPQQVQPTRPHPPPKMNFRKNSIGHCSDVHAYNFEEDVIYHGHNEDWSNEIRPLMYFVSYKAVAPSSSSSSSSSSSHHPPPPHPPHPHPHPPHPRPPPHPHHHAKFHSCAGLVYPGMIVGNAATWNDLGLFYTQNAMFPNWSKAWGLASNFIQRMALCEVPHGVPPIGPHHPPFSPISSSPTPKVISSPLFALEKEVKAAAETSFSKPHHPPPHPHPHPPRPQAWYEPILSQLTVLGQTMGFSLNVVNYKARQSFNIEVWEDWHAIRYIGPGWGRHRHAVHNHTHFNKYKLEPLVSWAIDNSTYSPVLTSIYRQATANTYAAPSTKEDVIQILGDHSLPIYNIYNNVTLLTTILDGNNGNLSVYCNKNPKFVWPTYNWTLDGFFDL